MHGDSMRWPLLGVLIGLMSVLGACGHQGLFGSSTDEDPGINAYPTNYKTDILGGMRAYLNDPTGIRAAGISEPMLKSVANSTRYVVCVQFNGKLPGNNSASDRQLAAVFLAGHFDRFVEKAQEPCAGVTYTPFPELEKMPRY